MSTVRSLPRSHAWLRALVLLLALTVPGAHAVGGVVHAASTVSGAGIGTGAGSGPGSGSGSGEIAEYDVLDTVLQPPARSAHRRPCVPLRRAPAPAALGRAPGAPQVRPRPAPPLPYSLRSVVLRC
ncbi:hypothetical protein [Streptomyces sp. SAS_270]|uniref:hypothetical protein n=1 Tax=Streptomyces sp. SAS_270 TaxID=3412748 RepID=UPI00403CDEFE